MEDAADISRTLVAEVIAIGDELTTGQRLDTNTQWLASRLTEAGIKVLYHSTVADDRDAHAAVLKAAAERADVVVTTGGLGPTADDLTREVMAEAAGVDLYRDPELAQSIERIWTSRGREMPPQNLRQAELPEGATAIPNPGGTAPGVDLTINSCRIFALPGVPAEMREMWEQTVQPAVAAMTGHTRVTRHWLVRCFGAGESTVEAMIPELIARGREPLVGITASQATITLRITASGASEQACWEAMQPTIAEAREKLGDLIYAEHSGTEPDAELHSCLLSLLCERRLTLSTYESMTRGLLSQWLATADPSGGIYLQGKVGTQIDDFTRSEAIESDCAIRIGSVVENEVPFKVETSNGIVEKCVMLVGHPSIHRSLVAKHALNTLRLELLKA